MDEFVTVRVTTKIAVLGGAEKHLVQADGEKLWGAAALAHGQTKSSLPGIFVSLRGQSHVRHAREVQRRFNSKQGVLGDLRLLLRTQQQFWN